MFSVTGQLDDGREAFVSWHDPEERRAVEGQRRGLVGDEQIIAAALLAEVERRSVRATPTGPFFLVDLDDPEAALVLLAGYFRPGSYRLHGSPPSIDASVPEGAIP